MDNPHHDLQVRDILLVVQMVEIVAVDESVLDGDCGCRALEGKLELRNYDVRDYDGQLEHDRDAHHVDADVAEPH